MLKRANRLTAALCLALAAGLALAADRVAAPTRTLGDPPPTLNVDFIQGDPITLEEGLGKNVFVIEFWATWCGPCRITMPHMTELQKTYADRGLVVIGISNEDEATVAPFLEEMGDKVGYRIALDRVNITNNRYFDGFGKQSAYPTAWVVDGNGRVVWIGMPGNPFLDELVGKLVDDLPGIAKERANKPPATPHE